MRLTQEQSDMVAENHNLIYGFARDFGLDVEEWYGDLAIELCKSVIIHDEDKGSLSTLFYSMANNIVNSTYRSNNRLKRQDGGLLSLDYEYGGDEGEPYTLLDIVDPPTNQSVESVADTNTRYNSLLSGKYGDVVELRILGYTQEEIADARGVSQQYISEILQELRRDYEGEFNR